MRNLVWPSITTIVMCAICPQALAQPVSGYPSKPMRMIVAFPAGGPTDIQARVIARQLSETLGQPVVVDNRGGAGGVIGAEAAAKAAPDGHTIFLASISVVMTPLMMQKTPYDPLRDFTAITMVSTNPYVMLVHPSLPIKSVKEFIALAKARPGQLNYASSGSGTPPHLGVELLKNAANIDIVHIPHKGAAPALTDLLAGHVAMLFNNPLIALPQVKAGKARALAVTTSRRSAAMPDLPTLAESGIRGVDVGSWFALLAPAGTPREVVVRLQKETSRIIMSPEVRMRLEADGAELIGSSPEELAAYMKSEVTKWGKVIKTINVRMD